MQKPIILALCGTALFAAESLNAQSFLGDGPRVITATGTITEDFSAIAGRAGSAWSDVSGLHSSDASSSGSVSGSSTTTGTFSYRTGTPVDDSFGMVNSTTGETVYIGFLYQNTSGVDLQVSSLSYNLEQWRSSSANVQRNNFSYSVSSTAPTTWTSGSFTDVDALDMVSFVHTSAGGLGSGGLSSDYVRPVSSNLDIVIPDGQYLLIRWEDAYDGETGHALALDDISITFTQAVPEPGAGALLGLIALGAILRRRRAA